MFRFGSKRINRTEYRCTIRFLDDEEAPLECDFQHLCKGQFVLDFVCKSIGLLEKDYFGLRYVDADNQRRWLDLSKPVLKQTKGLSQIIFCFRVKFYPPNPLELKEESTRFQIYLQLKRDLSHGRLNCTQTEAALCVAYIKQAELGDFVEGGENGVNEDDSNSTGDFRILPKHTQEIDEKIERIHKNQLKGLSATDAQDLFLKQSACLESYGIDPHPVKDDKNQQIYIGINHLGILTFLSGKKNLHIRFDDLVKFNYEGKMFILHVRFSNSSRKQVIGFKCPSQAACMHLFNCANDIRCFFTSIAPSMNNRNTLSRNMSIKRKRESSMVSTSQLALNNNQDNLLKQGPENNTIQEETLKRTNDLNALNKHYQNGTIEKNATADIDSLLVHSDDDEDGERLLASSVPLVTPVLDSTPTRNLGGVVNGDLSLNNEMHDPMEDRIADHPDYTRIEEDTFSKLPTGFRHLQMFVLTWLVMLLLISVSTICVLESESALFEDFKSWPPLVVLRREYYHPIKAFINSKLILHHH